MNYFVSNDGNKNQYQNLGEARSYTLLRPAFILIIIGLSMAFLMLSVWNFNNSMNQMANTHVYYLHSRQSPSHIVSERFLSFGLDTSLLRDITNLPLLNEKFVNLARHLAPAYVRVGGTSADCLYFNKSPGIISKRIFSPVDGSDISNFTITDMDLENLYNFASRSELRMIFDLNVLIRDADGSWDDSNAREIISFAKKSNMELDWQLGNEQLARDFYHLRQLLNEAGYGRSLLVGPEVNHVGDADHAGELYAGTFLEEAKNSVDYVTWHQYYLNGRKARVEDFLNPETFNYLQMQIQSMKDIIKSSSKNILMWLSETSTAYGGGAPELSDRFVAGFLWLDKLGYSARSGLNVVTRQSFFGGNYAMVGPDLTPNPDWWVSVVYKEFVSERVLKLTSPSNVTRVRLYAHCTPKKALISRVPAITVYGLNIDKSAIRVAIQGIFPILHKNAKVFFYALTSDDLQSSEIKMNGKILKLQANGDLPPFRPVILEPGQMITLPPYSMVFMVIHGAEAPACSA